MRRYLPKLSCFFLLLLASAVVFLTPHTGDAGCGCDKPPPAPASIIPNVAFPGMQVTLFHRSFKAGQLWAVRFLAGTTNVTVSGRVVVKRDITNRTGKTYTPQLVVTVPNLPPRPTRIVVSTPNATSATLIVSERSFTVIGKPVVVAEQTADFDILNYKTGVGMDGTLYVAVGGLAQVCQSMKFKMRLVSYPLDVGVGDIAIINSQGFFIDVLGAAASDHFSIKPDKAPRSDRLIYLRHSFEQYCTDHRPGGRKTVDLQDPNWHRDGTPHVDYSTLIFSFSGQLNGTTPKPGTASFEVDVETVKGDGIEPWEDEKPEEGVHN